MDKELRNTYNHTIITQMRKLVLLKWPNIMQICFYTSPIIPLLVNEIQNQTPISCFAISMALAPFSSSGMFLQSFLLSHHTDILTKIYWPVFSTDAP